jgi:hypothetical protein
LNDLGNSVLPPETHKRHPAWHAHVTGSTWDKKFHSSSENTPAKAIKTDIYPILVSRQGENLPYG